MTSTAAVMAIECGMSSGRKSDAGLGVKVARSPVLRQNRGGDEAFSPTRVLPGVLLHGVPRDFGFDELT
jgi:hypothetical protein